MGWGLMATPGAALSPGGSSWFRPVSGAVWGSPGSCVPSPRFRSLVPDREFHHKPGLPLGAGSCLHPDSPGTGPRTAANVSPVLAPLWLIWSLSCSWATEQVPSASPGDTKDFSKPAEQPLSELPFAPGDQQQGGSVHLFSVAAGEPGFGP